MVNIKGTSLEEAGVAYERVRERYIRKEFLIIIMAANMAFLYARGLFVP